MNHEQLEVLKGDLQFLVTRASTRPSLCRHAQRNTKACDGVLSCATVGQGGRWTPNTIQVKSR